MKNETIKIQQNMKREKKLQATTETAIGFMRCYKMFFMTCNLTIPNYNIESVNKKILNSIMAVPDNVRKEVRMLAKQYEILEVYQEPPMMCNEHIIRENPWLIKYKHFGHGGEEFLWSIDANRMRL